MTVQEFIQKHGTKVKSNRGGWISCCVYPTHRDSTPSFHISWEGLFYCWGCGKKGGYATLLHDIAGWSWKKSIDYADALSKGTKWHKVEETIQPPEKLSRGLLALFEVNWEEGYQRWLLAQATGDTHRPPWAFPFEKGFTPLTLNHFQAGYDDNGQRITIPIFGHDQFRGLMGRACDPEGFPKYYIYPPVKPSRYLYNVESVRPEHETVILVEGAWDVWMLHQKGITFDIPAVSLFTSKISYEQVQQLARLNRTYVLMFDADKSGKDGGKEVASALLAMGLKIDVAMDFPKGITDIKKMNASQLMAAYTQRKQYPSSTAHKLLTW